MTDHPKEHGLLFKPDMVGAYFAGLKSQTRRVITRRNSYIDGGPAYKNIWDELQFDKAWIDRGPSPAGNAGPYLQVPRVERVNGKIVDEYVHRVYPRYQAGDVIWGREGWAVGRGYDGVPPRDLPGPSKSGFRINMSYRSDPETEWSLKGRGQWRPSIFMPRCFARIVTPILAVRPERVQDISEEDARAEGIDTECELWHVSQNILDNLGVVPGATHDIPKSSPDIAVFRDLWDKINGKKYPWISNPLVWAISFKAYEK